MSESRHLIIDPGVSSLLRLTSEKEVLELDKAEEELGVRTERVRNWVEVLSEKDLLTADRDSRSKKISIKPENREKLEKEKIKSEKDLEEAERQVKEKIMDFNKNIIRSMNDKDDEGELERQKRIQDLLSSALDSIENKKYLEAVEDLEKAEELSEDSFNRPEEALIHSLRINTKVADKASLILEPEN